MENGGAVNIQWSSETLPDWVSCYQDVLIYKFVEFFPRVSDYCSIKKRE